VSPGRMCECSCDCGTSVVVYRSNLSTGKTRSCGCQRGPAISARFTRHGESCDETPEYKTWMMIRYRCNDKDNPNYGGRGIRVDCRWDEYGRFLSDMGRKPSPDHQIERIDNDGDYSPDNCRWATRKEQGRNRRNSALLTAFGRTATVVEWAESTGINYGTLWSRLNEYNWTPERAVSK
jgi:hypothetical protein